jgi:histidinol-phosphate/aromatic aminotransferase/cobyric acid decarboxylase-like protein
MRSHTTIAARPSRGGGRLPEVRLDRVRQPYGPCPAAQEAADTACDSPLPALAEHFRQRLGQTYRVSAGAISLVAGADSALARIVERTDGPLIGFPPSALAAGVLDSASGRDVLALGRGSGLDSSVPLDLAMDLPSTGIAIVDSPSNPLGSLLSFADAVRLARACRFLVVDERYAELAGFSLLHLSAEFENVVIVRSFEYWAGIDDPPCAWVASSPRTADALGLDADPPRREAIAGALATLDSLDSVEATLRLLREERSRLYRFLRKLSFLEPIPSWGPFLAARVDLVPRARVISGLAARNIHLHAPEEAGLERVVRIGIGSRSAMDRLRAALLEVGSELIA